MKKLTLILPLYNDWKSVNLLLKKISLNLKKEKFSIHVIIVNDKSSEKIFLNKKEFKNINKVEVFNLKRNVGSQVAIFLALKKIKKKNNNSTIVIMDSDGEDDPSKLKILIKKSQLSVNSVLFAKRIGRRETLILRILNQIRLFLTYILTGKYLDIGNYSAFNSKNLKDILINDHISVAYCSGVVKNIKNINYYGIKKSKRYFGNSKVNIYFILKHSINIIAVFYKEIFLRSSILYLFFLIFFSDKELNLLAFLLYLFINIFFIGCFFLNTIKDYSTKMLTNIKKIK